ncbi:unnamed protein product [Haemonchus placei]|uniref:DUF2052 domain-containing protein n=1 Tax=Haemonchus placei TaxID=6290 RepID=A0A0N4X9W7_HAEPC|nr:unnamed protein product [Haemonchus placei]
MADTEFYRKYGSEYLRRIQEKQEGPKPDLEAERQAYTLFYRKKVKKGNESGTRFHVEQIPERFTELRGFVSPLGSECGPLDAEQTRSQKYYENIINGDIDEEELQEVKEWEENSRREFEEARSRSKHDIPEQHLWTTEPLSSDIRSFDQKDDGA